MENKPPILKVYKDSEIHTLAELSNKSNGEKVPAQIIELDGYHYYVESIKVMTENYMEVCLQYKDGLSLMSMYVRSLREARIRLRDDMIKHPDITKGLLRTKVVSEVETDKTIIKKERPPYLRLVKKH